MAEKSDTVQQIKERLSIVDVVSQYVKLERAGSSVRARCPFHAERTPSFHVSPERGTYHCFGCGVGGDMFSFVEAIEGVDFKGALKMLADKAGVPLVYSRGTPKEEDNRDRLFELLETATVFFIQHLSADAKKYLHDRGLEDSTITQFRVGYCGNDWTTLCDYLKNKGFSEKEMLEAGIARKNERGQLSDKFRNRIIFPIGDTAGRIVGFSGRTFGAEASPDAPKYLNSPETPLFHKSNILYGYDRAKMSMRKLQCAILVEGQMDLLLSHQIGWDNTVAVSGTAFTREHAQLLRRMTDNLLIAFDGDSAGIKAAGKAARVGLASGLNVKVAELEEGKDPADSILAGGVESWKLVIKNAKDIISFLLDVLAKHAPEKDKYRRLVESVVLPFLSDMQSPIAREQALQQVAGRLGVSQGAIEAALAHVPVEAVPQSTVQAPIISARPDLLSKAQNIYAIILWQKTLSKPTIADLSKLEKMLQSAVGDEVMKTLTELPESVQERLRFTVESLYKEDASPEKDIRSLLKIVEKDRLSLELQAVSDQLRTAELEGNDDLMAQLLTISQKLTQDIARLHTIE